MLDALLEHRFERHVDPLEVGREVDRTRLLVDVAGRSDADAGAVFFARGGEDLLHHLLDLVDHRGRLERDEVALGLLDDRAVGRDGAGGRV